MKNKLSKLSGLFNFKNLGPDYFIEREYDPFEHEKAERDNSTQAFLIVGLFVFSACLLIAVVTMRAEASLLGI